MPQPHIPRAGLPRPSEASLAAAMTAGTPDFQGPVTELDVREDLRKGEEPFSRIMDAVNSLASDGVLHLRATFEPVPLFHVLGRQGFAHHAVAHAPDNWSVWFFRPEAGASIAPPASVATPALTPVPATVPATPPPAASAREIHLDVRGLEPPEPMMRTLEALESLPEGAVLVQHNVRVPQFLLPILAERGFAHEVQTTDDDGVYVRITRST